MNERLHLLTDLDPNRKAEDVPPVLQVDAVWVTLLRANGRVRRDFRATVTYGALEKQFPS